jgi:predicted O-methyltransferase YrrM
MCLKEMLNQINTVINRMADNRKATAEDGKEYDLNKFAVRNDQGEIIERIVEESAPSTTLEVGCASGLSSLYIARGRLKAGKFSDNSMHIIDLKQTTHWHNIGRKAIEQAGIKDKVSFYEQAAHTVLPELLKKGLRIQFAFLDGWHLTDYVMLETFYCDKILDTGGVLMYHDMHLQGLQLFTAFWIANCNYEPVSLQEGRITSKPYKTFKSYSNAYPYFAKHVAPYVHNNMIALRKKGEDKRKGEDYKECVKVLST